MAGRVGPPPEDLLANQYRIKGITYRNAMRVWERSVPGGMDALRASLRDPELVAFANQPFLASAWYDVYPFPRLSEAAARLSGLAVDRFVRNTCRRQATDELSTVHRALLRLLGPSTVSRHLPRLQAQYLDFGRTSSEDVGPNHVLVTQSGIPRELATWVGWVSTEYLVVALELCGARAINVAGQSMNDDGQHAPLVSTTWSVRWT